MLPLELANQATGPVVGDRREQRPTTQRHTPNAGPCAWSADGELTGYVTQKPLYVPSSGRRYDHSNEN